MLPRLYAIADAATLRGRGISLRRYAEELRRAGTKLVQYRDKDAAPREILRAGEILREVFAGSGCKLIMNDRVDLALLAACDGVHLGQGDLSPEVARRLLPPGRIVGLSAHVDEQVRAADLSAADYVAIGPVFATATKRDAEPVVGLEGVRRARALTAKPLVAIGGIKRENCQSVVDAGADSVAIISGLLVPGESTEEVARDFLRLLR